MKEYDIVELIHERPSYRQAGVKLGDFGAVMSEKPIDGAWQVIFSEFYTGRDIADIMVLEEDLKVYSAISSEKLPVQSEEYISRQRRKTYSVVSSPENEFELPYMCKMCGQSVVEEHGDVCGVCGWIDDEAQNKSKTAAGANPLSFDAYSEFWAKNQDEIIQNSKFNPFFAEQKLKQYLRTKKQ